MRDQTQDFIKLLKTNFRRWPVASHDDQRVLCRTRSTMALEGMSVPAERFYRTQDQQNLALFTPQTEPYRPLGEPCLDAFSLVINCMQDGLSEQAITDALRLSHKEPQKFSKYDTEQKIDQIKTQKKGSLQLPELKNAMRTRHLASKSAGMKNVHDVLKESDNRLVAVRAGQSFVQHFLEYHAMKAMDRLRNEDEMEASERVAIKTFSSNYLLAVIGTAQDMIPIHSKVTADSPVHESARTSGGALAKDPETLREEMKLSNFLEKLETVYTILSSISNMTPRHLKQTVPLDREQLKQLKKCPFSRLPGIDNATKDFSKRCSTARQQHEGMEFNLGKHRKKKRTSSTASVSSSSSNMSLMEPSNSHAPGTEGRDFRALAQHRTSKRFVRAPANSSTNSRRMPRISSLREESKEVIETWEDLVKGPRHKGTSKQRMPKWFFLTQEKLVPVKEEDRVAAPKSLPDHFPTGTSSRARAKYILANEEMQGKADEILAKHAEERLSKCQMRWNCLSLPKAKVSWKQQRLMMNKFNEMDLTKQRDHHSLCPWFDTLNAEAVLLYNSIEPHVERALDKMSKFAKANIDHIPNGKEKLCLLAFSLPYYEIKQPIVQAAFKFILSNLFKQREEMFDLWLTDRNIQ